MYVLVQAYPKRSPFWYPIILSLVLNVLFVRALNDRLHRKALIVNAPNPGMCVSSLRRNLKFPVNIITRIADRLIARTSEEGGRLFVLAAIGAEEKRDSLRGEYLSVGEPREPSDYVLGEAGRKMQDKLWVRFLNFPFQMKDPVLLTSILIERSHRRTQCGWAKNYSNCEGLSHRTGQ